MREDLFSTLKTAITVGFGYPSRQRVVVSAGASFEHDLITIDGSVPCLTPAGETICRCGHFTLEWGALRNVDRPPPDTVECP